MAAIAERHRQPLAADEYIAMVQRTRALVREHVPPTTTLAVVSRGDEALLAHPGRQAWHFPRAASGAYAGHHPSDSAAAVAHLEEMRTSGAGALVVPASARWWLDHYDGFAEHLHERCELVVDDDACAIFSLGGIAAPAGERTHATEAAAPDDAPAWEQLRRFLDALLPERCQVLVAGSGWEALDLRPRVVTPLAPEAALDLLDGGRPQDGPAYLVVPLGDRLDGRRSDLLDAVARRGPALARRDRLAAVVDLHMPTATHGRVPA
jgi:hypothetical protein